jgi:hypothetical protein
MLPPLVWIDPPLENVRPPFVIVCPPFTLIVDAFRVDGIPPPPGGGYVLPLTELTKRFGILPVLVLIVTLLIEGSVELLLTTRLLRVVRPVITFRSPFVILCPPFTLMVDASRVEGIPPPPPGGYGALLIVFTFMLFVLI